jgi:hypothetical protein
MLASCFLIFKHHIFCAFCMVLHMLISWQLNSGSLDIWTCMKEQQPSVPMLSVYFLLLVNYLILLCSYVSTDFDCTMEFSTVQNGQKCVFCICVLLQ